MRLVIVLSLLVTLAVPCTARAAVPAPHPPNTKALAALGVKVSWPVHARAVKSVGDVVTVKVTSLHLHAQVSLVTLGHRGRVLHALARRTLRNGTFRARLGAVGTYALRLTVDGKRYWSRITVPVVDPVTGICASYTGDSAVLRLGATTVRAGATLPFQLVNTSHGCEVAGAAYTFQRPLPDGTWQSIDTGQVFPAIAFPLTPGKRLDKSALVPADFAPGHYRLRDTALSKAVSGGMIVATAEFDVTG